MRDEVLRQRSNAVRDEEEEKQRLAEVTRRGERPNSREAAGGAAAGRRRRPAKAKRDTERAVQVKDAKDSSERLEQAVKQLERELGEAKANRLALESKIRELEEVVEESKNKASQHDQAEAEEATRCDDLSRIQVVTMAWLLVVVDDDDDDDDDDIMMMIQWLQEASATRV
eukprot:519937-Hanusia_phi.AAC.4